MSQKKCIDCGKTCDMCECEICNVDGEGEEDELAGMKIVDADGVEVVKEGEEKEVDDDDGLSDEY